MLVAISGSQGAGKTTIIKALAENDGYKAVTRKTSRSILSDWGVSLQDVNNDPTLTMKFQQEIISRKYRDELTTHTHPSDVVITERTFMDLAIYNTVVLGHNNEYSTFVDQYYNQCMSYTQSYDLIFYLHAGHFQIEHDGVRGSNMHYSRLIDLALEDALKTVTLPGRLITIDTPILEQRVAIIKTMIETKKRQMFNN